jgi:3-oxoacyl-[acyl-carrier protein] reductase
MGDFKGKVAVVTGAAGGMGYETAAMLVAEGAEVVMIDLKEPSGLPEGAGRAQFAQGDVTDWPFIQDVFDGLSRLDHLVNAAGVLLFGEDVSAIDIDLKVWDRVMDVNLKAMVLTMKAAVPMMQGNRGGSIVNIASTQCLRGDPKPQDAYQASKAGVIALTKSIAIQYAHAGIRANCVLPGQTWTPMQMRWDTDPAAAKRAAEHVPLGRVGQAEDMAAAVLFLLSDRASFITGTELTVDGGVTALP